MKIKEEFFARSTEIVARELIGKYLVRKLDEGMKVALITATEAYRGKEKRDREGIFYPPGKIYMYPFRGHYILNISTEAEGIPACVLIHEVEIEGERYGPIKLVKEMKIDKNFDGKSIESEELFILDPVCKEEIKDKVLTRMARYRLKNREEIKGMVEHEG